MSAKIRRYVREKEDWQFRRGYNHDELEASQLRKNFLRQYIINFDTNLYKTQEQRDWAYIAKRQYNYDVILKGLGYSILLASCILTWRIYSAKRMVWWPYLTIPVSYQFISQILLQKHSKKLFDMCNLGEDFHLGAKRNEVLRECNRILQTEDF